MNNILMAIFLRVVAVYLAISIFNCINFTRAANICMGKKPRRTWRRLRAVLKFGFGWRRPLMFWLLDWYLGLFNPMKMVELMRGR